MIHLRLVVPPQHNDDVMRTLRASASVCNIVSLPGAAEKPFGDLILCDVAREDASVVISELRDLRIDREGSIAVENVDSSLSDVAVAAEKAAAGMPSDAVIWEEVEDRTSEESKLSFTFAAFMILAMLIATSGILLDLPILIVGAMVVGPEFGPIAGISVAAVERRGGLAARSFLALLVGFPLGITVSFIATLLFKETGLIPDLFYEGHHSLASLIATPDFFSFFVAFCAGIAGMLSLTTAKSGALIGVLISVTTIPAAANIAISAALGDWSDWRGSQLQLILNVSAIVLSGVLTLLVQRFIYHRRSNRRKVVDNAEAGTIDPRQIS